MPSIADALLADGFETHITGFHGNTFRIELCRLFPANQGRTFTATDVVEPQISFETELGDDPRECTRLMVPQSAANLVEGLESQDIISGRGTTWTLIRRENNPSDNSIDFWIKQNVEGKDE